MDTLIVMSSSYAQQIRDMVMSTPENEHNHQHFGPVPEQFLYNPGEDILLSTEEEILRFYTENGRGVLLGRAVTVLRTGGYLIIDDLEKHFSKEIVHMILELSDLFLSNYPGGTAPKSDTLLKFSFFKGLTLYGNSP